MPQAENPRQNMFANTVGAREFSCSRQPVDFPPRRLQHDFAFAFAGSGVADGQANGNSDAECAENRWHRVFAHEMLGTLECPARLLFRLVPRLAHFRGSFLCCSTKLLTPS